MSCACACHCVALPAVVVLLPVLGAALDERVESALVAATVLVGTVGLAPAAWRTVATRGWWWAPALFLVGIALLRVARVLDERDAGSAGDAGVLAGAALVATAHVVNRRRRAVGDCATVGGDPACRPCPDDRDVS